MDIQETLFNYAYDFLLSANLDEVKDVYEAERRTSREMALMSLGNDCLDIIGYQDLYEFLEENELSLLDVTVSPTGMNKGKGLFI